MELFKLDQRCLGCLSRRYATEVQYHLAGFYRMTLVSLKRDQTQPLMSRTQMNLTISFSRVTVLIDNTTPEDIYR